MRAMGQKSDVVGDPSAIFVTTVTGPFSAIRPVLMAPALISLILLVLVATPFVSDPAFAQAAIESGQPAATNDKKEISSASRQRERETGEDPMARALAEKEDQPEAQIFRHNVLEPYGSLRFGYGATDLVDDFTDGGSRIGLNGELQFRPRFWLIGRAEVGINIFDALDRLIDASGRPSRAKASLPTRLLYTGIETLTATVIAGKNWSTYYQVSAITDRFESFGGEASGTFNALTDGGPTGTGRADNVLQGRFSVDFLPERLKIKPFKLNLQAQPGESIPRAGGAKYDYSVGFSAILETEREFNFGIAYNQAAIAGNDLPELGKIGINGDARALVLGTRKFGEKSYLGTTYSWLKNHETTNEGIYFDAWGWEVFASYNVSGNWWAVGGWNMLEPQRSERRIPEYRIRYGVLGVRYTFAGFRNMIYSEIRLDDSRNANGTQPGNVYTVGVRWDLP